MTIQLSGYEAGARYSGDYERDLAALQERLSRILVSHIVRKRRSVIVFDGWDAAGKGGAIRRLTSRLDPRGFRVWPVAAPTDEERARHFLWRFWQRLPGAGEIAIFEGSWYRRVLGERVEGSASPEEWRRAYDEINEFEAQQSFDGTTLVKLFFHITQETQDERLRARLDHPWKRLKVTKEQVRNRSRRADYLTAAEEMLERTDTRWGPWTVIDANDKKAARIAALSAVAEALEANCPAAAPDADPELEALARAAFRKDG